MKKVLFVMPNLTGGGAEKVLIDILKHIDKSKFDITLLLFEKKGVYIEEIPREIKVICVREKMGIIPGRIWIDLLKKYPKKFYKYIMKNKKYDVEIAFMEGTATNFVGNSTNSKSKKIAWVHTDLNKFHWTKRMFLGNNEEICYNNFNDIVFVSNDSKKSFENLFSQNKSKKQVIYNPVIDYEIINKSKEFDVKFDDFTVISVGRLDYQKGYDRLIKAHAKLVNKYPHKLLILGEGLERKNLEVLVENLNVKESVELKGFVKNPYPYIKDSDLFVCSSRAEGYPLVVCESIILNTPVLSTDITGPREILENGKYGIISNNSIDGIYNKLNMLLKDKDIIKIYKNKCNEKSKYLNYKEMIKRIETIIHFD